MYSPRPQCIYFESIFRLDNPLPRFGRREVCPLPRARGAGGGVFAGSKFPIDVLLRGCGWNRPRFRIAPPPKPQTPSPLRPRRLPSRRITAPSNTPDLTPLSTPNPHRCSPLSHTPLMVPPPIARKTHKCVGHCDRMPTAGVGPPPRNPYTYYTAIFCFLRPLNQTYYC